jgi:hypothetical protein
MCHRRTEALGAKFESLAAVAVFVCGVAIAIIDHPPAAVWAAVIVAGGGAWQAWDMRELGGRVWARVLFLLGAALMLTGL